MGREGAAPPWKSGASGLDTRGPLGRAEMRISVILDKRKTDSVDLKQKGLKKHLNIEQSYR